MAAGQTEKQLEALAAARRDPHSPNSAALLRKALKARSSAVVAKAAQIIAQSVLPGFDSDLAAAFERLLDAPASQDRGCEAKKALAEAMRAIEHFSRDLFRRGIRHVQREPTWGGTVDTASNLRATCALALVDARDPDALLLAVDLAADPEHLARIGAIAALASSGRPEAILALRMKALAGDAHPDVTAECFSGLLTLDRRGSFDFVARFLHDTDPQRIEAAALALAATREPRALELLAPLCRDAPQPDLRRSVIGAIAAMRTDEAITFLIRTIRESRQQDAEAALTALASSRPDEALAQRIAAAIQQRDTPDLLATARQLGLPPRS